MTSTTVADLAAETHRHCAARVARREQQTHTWGQGPDAVLGVAIEHGDAEKAGLVAAQVWQRELFDAGLAWVDGPEEFGGRGLSDAHTRAVRSVIAEFDVPNTTYFMVGHDIVGPTILAHGTPEQKARWLPGIWRGDVLCCQLFSEPEAGSDLASLRTSAAFADGEWVVNGQKVWSSGAHFSQLGELLARTGSSADRHRGITAFLVEMDCPGVDVRPLRQITGSEHFNEVFLDDVRLPDADRIGAVNDGWAVAQTALGGERSLVGDENSGILNDPVRRLFDLADHLGVAHDPAIAELLGQAWVRDQMLHATGERLSAADAPPGSVVKLLMVENMQFYVDLAARLLGERMIVDHGDWGTYVWSELLLGAPAHRIGGGTDEIQRNILAERVLGLPREQRPTPNPT